MAEMSNPRHKSWMQMICGNLSLAEIHTYQLSLLGTEKLDKRLLVIKV